MGLGVYLTVNDTNINHLELIRDITAFSGVASGAISVKNVRNKTVSKRLSRKFLSDIRGLRSNTE